MSRCGALEAAVFAATLGGCTPTPTLDFEEPTDGGDASDGLTSGMGPDGSGKADAANDASEPRGDGGYTCGNNTVSDCTQCAGARLLCPTSNRCVSACASACAANPVECFACSNGNQLAVARCQPAASPAACIGGSLNRCTCNNAANCPGGNQSCVSQQCVACGEPNSNNAGCKGNQRCDAQKYTCD